MEQIISAVIAGLFVIMAFFAGHIIQTFTSKKRKTEDLANLMIPRRAELYREFFCAVAKTGIQRLKYEGDTPKGQKIIELHDLCNRSIYEMCPYGSIKFLNCVMKLSQACSDHRQNVLEKREGAWEKFKTAFLFNFHGLPAIARADCFGPDFDHLMGNKVKHLVSVSDMAKEFTGTASLKSKKIIRNWLKESNIKPDKKYPLPKYYWSKIERAWESRT